VADQREGCVPGAGGLKGGEGVSATQGLPGVAAVADQREERVRGRERKGRVGLAGSGLGLGRVRSWGRWVQLGRCSSPGVHT
jgi:hypothetical protein